jgi:hypothetical protein
MCSEENSDGFIIIEINQNERKEREAGKGEKTLSPSHEPGCVHS